MRAAWESTLRRVSFFEIEKVHCNASTSSRKQITQKGAHMLTLRQGSKLWFQCQLHQDTNHFVFKDFHSTDMKNIYNTLWHFRNFHKRFSPYSSPCVYTDELFIRATKVGNSCQLYQSKYVTAEVVTNSSSMIFCARYIKFCSSCWSVIGQVFLFKRKEQRDLFNIKGSRPYGQLCKSSNICPFKHTKQKSNWYALGQTLYLFGCSTKRPNLKTSHSNSCCYNSHNTHKKKTHKKWTYN